MNRSDTNNSDEQEEPTVDEMPTLDDSLKGRLKSAWHIIRQTSGAKEKSSKFDGVLSYAGEWHALIIGIGVGLYMPQHATAFIGYAVGRGGGKRKWSEDAHMKDVVDEPVYAIVGVVIGMNASPELIQQLIPNLM